MLVHTITPYSFSRLSSYLTALGCLWPRQSLHTLGQSPTLLLLPIVVVVAIARQMGFLVHSFSALQAIFQSYIGVRETIVVVVANIRQTVGSRSQTNGMFAKISL
jgi:hypothetical protein